MIPLTIMVCTLGIPAALGPNHEHCYFYNVEISVPADEVPEKIIEFCDTVRETATKHGGSITKCKVIILSPIRLPPDEPGIKV